MFKGRTITSECTLRRKYPYSELFGSTFPYLVRMRENAHQNNSEYGHFSRSGTAEDYFDVIVLTFNS